MAAVTTTTAQFTAPAAGSTVNIDMGDTDWIDVGTRLLIETAGVYDVTSITSSTRVVGRNLGYSVNAAATTVIASGVDVNPVGFSSTEPMNNYGGHSATTTKGDLLVDAGTNSGRPALARQAVGTDGQILCADSTTGTGVDWKTIVPTSASTATDNVIARFNNTTGALNQTPVQTSNLVISDTGAIQSTPSGGDARGTSAIDLQVVRTANTQVASGTASTIAGGQSNTASGTSSVVAGGNTNLASNTGASVLGGTTNIASAAQASVAGGTGNEAQGTNSFVGGGTGNIAASTDSAVVAGNGNEASAAQAFVGGGLTNTASGTGAVVTGGQLNVASGAYSFASGSGALADKQGQSARSPGNFAAAGDCQSSELILRNATTDATATVLFLNGSSARPTVPEDTTWMVHGLLAARRDDGSSGVREIKCGIENTGGTTALKGAATITTIGTDDAGITIAGVAVTADNANDALQVQVTGAVGQNIRWACSLRIVEVAY